ncbi:hypothetical protein MF672_010695 [Actinomadura sp. ATCC 31491]|uniref:Uncharacterized protein n=1 Tax=Actinomadura luzonensis TaxID=2805427 RepID=A0ABT0FPJ0_9ACTN|nr:hypothetical protein [Actinomadura luzonensis]MCK2214254.1 hypothetical protein [Actinomadura luzonensis]
MKVYDTVVSQLSGPRGGRIVERHGRLVPMLDFAGSAIELDSREELVKLGTDIRQLIQDYDAAEARRQAGLRPIPAHGLPARPYTPAGADAAAPAGQQPRGAHAAPPRPPRRAASASARSARPGGAGGAGEAGGAGPSHVAAS